MTFWSNLLGYQLVWFLLVTGAADGRLWPALLAGALFVAWQVGTSRHPLSDVRLLGVAVLLGMLVDGVAAATGWLHYASPSPALPPHGAPLWIVVLWACFSTTINRSLAVVRGRPWLAALLGGIGAPLAYLAAARGWHAVTLSPVTGLLWIGACWALALPVLATLGQRWAHPSEARPA